MPPVGLSQITDKPDIQCQIWLFFGNLAKSGIRLDIRIRFNIESDKIQ